MLSQPEAHEALSDEPWSVEKARAAIASIVADAEEAFEDGWSTHPRDLVEGEDPKARLRTVYDGGAGVVDAFHRLARRGIAELGRDYVPYLERSLEAHRTSPTRTPSAACGQAKRAFGWCCRSSRRRRRISSGCPSSWPRTSATSVAS